MKSNRLHWLVPGLAAAGLLMGAAVTPSSAAPAAAEAPAAAAAPAAATPAPPPPEVKTLLDDVCSNCHDISVTTDVRKSRGEWETTIDNMIGHGASLSDQQAGLLVDYLAKNYSPASR